MASQTPLAPGMVFRADAWAQGRALEGRRPPGDEPACGIEAITHVGAGSERDNAPDRRVRVVGDEQVRELRPGGVAGHGVQIQQLVDVHRVVLRGPHGVSHAIPADPAGYPPRLSYPRSVVSAPLMSRSASASPVSCQSVVGAPTIATTGNRRWLARRTPRS